MPHKGAFAFSNLRRRRDSNPRYPLRYVGFQDRCIKPALPLLRINFQPINWPKLLKALKAIANVSFSNEKVNSLNKNIIYLRKMSLSIGYYSLLISADNNISHY